MKQLLKKRMLFTIILIVLPLAAAVICMGIGRYNLPPRVVVSSLCTIILKGKEALDKQIYSILIYVRLPRILLAVLCGSGLAVSGTAFQSLFSNGLATPDTLGVSAGACFGAAIALLMHLSLPFVQLSALICGFAAVLITYSISRKKGEISIIMVVLSGMAVSSLFSALVSLIKYAADTQEDLPAITYWLMGSLASGNYRSLSVGAPLIIIGILIIFFLRWRLNILTLSEDEARSMGINVKALRIIIGIAATLITSASVSMCGQVGWVGLLIPHICRMIFGSDNRDIVPASISFGAAFLVFIDTAARSMSAAEIPVSILTAIFGAPLFILLLRKSGGARL